MPGTGPGTGSGSGTGPGTGLGSGGNTSAFFAHEPRDEPKKKQTIDISMHESTPRRYQRAFESVLLPGSHLMATTAPIAPMNPIVSIIAIALTTRGREGGATASVDC
jgi:hypothetical protein